MKKIIAAGVVCGLLAGCNTVSAISTANTKLAELSGGKLQKACAIVNVAQGYFKELAAAIPPKGRTAYRDASVVVSAICNNPPKDVMTALVDLNAAWTEIQAATTVK